MPADQQCPTTASGYAWHPRWCATRVRDVIRPKHAAQGVLFKLNALLEEPQTLFLRGQRQGKGGE
jgi:hypothetical protein